MDSLHPILRIAKVVEAQRDIDFGGLAIIARKLGVTRAAVGQWKEPGRRVPAEYCPILQELTKGAVTCEDLRPDVRWDLVRKRRPVRVEQGEGQDSDDPLEPPQEPIQEAPQQS